MKLIREPKRQKMKTVQYFNLTLTVPEDTKYISVDQDGEIILWMDVVKPYVKLYHFNVSDWCGEVIEYDMGQVDLEEMDWKDSLREY
jgi:hypothetical protein